MGKEQSALKVAKTEPSPGPKVKTFEEIMEEKKAKRLGRFGGASSEDTAAKRKVKVKQSVPQGKTKRQESRKLPFCTHHLSLESVQYVLIMGIP